MAQPSGIARPGPKSFREETPKRVLRTIVDRLCHRQAEALSAREGFAADDCLWCRGGRQSLLPTGLRRLGTIDPQPHGWRQGGSIIALFAGVAWHVDNPATLQCFEPSGKSSRNVTGFLAKDWRAAVSLRWFARIHPLGHLPETDLSHGFNVSAVPDDCPLRSRCRASFLRHGWGFPLRDLSGPQRGLRASVSISRYALRTCLRVVVDGRSHGPGMASSIVVALQGCSARSVRW